MVRSRLNDLPQHLHLQPNECSKEGWQVPASIQLYRRLCNQPLGSAILPIKRMLPLTLSRIKKRKG
jgi:hypothetical protein